MAQDDPFKPCDVRGIYPSEVDERLLAALGRVVPTMWQLQGAAVLGGDARNSTASLLAALAGGVGGQCEVAVQLQPFPTPGLYYAGAVMQAGVTLIVTASHNPPTHNGLKLLVGGEAPSQADMRELAAATRAALRGAGRVVTPLSQRSDTAEWASRYVEHLLATAPATSALKVVVDPGNGCLCGVAARCLRRAGHEITEVHGTLDGSFPCRGPDPTAPGALSGLQQAVAATGSDLGVAYDGDGDRAVFVDGRGAITPADAAIALLAGQASAGSSGCAVLDVRTSRLLADWLRAKGVEVVWSRPGHAFVRTALRSLRARFGGEVSGHYFFGELGGDDALYATLRLLRLISDEGPLDELVASLPRSVMLGEVRLPYAGPPEPVLAAIRSRCSPLSVDDFGGGLSLDLGDAWVTARPSVTEPLIALRCEAITASRLREVAVRVEAGLNPFGLTMGETSPVDPLASAR